MVGRILRLFSKFGLLIAMGWHFAAPSAASAQSQPGASADKAMPAASADKAVPAASSDKPMPATSPDKAMPAASPEMPAASVRVRVGEHGGFDRIVFDWSSRVPYRVESKSGLATVIFERPARLDLSGYRDNPPPFFRSVKTRSEGKGTAVDIEVPEGTKLRHFLSGNSVVLDVLAPGTPQDAPAAGLRPAKPAKSGKAQTASAPTAKPAN